MPYSTTWRVALNPAAAFDGVLSAIQRLVRDSKGRLPRWELLSSAPPYSLHATRTTRMGWVDDITVAVSLEGKDDNGNNPSGTTSIISVMSNNREGLYDFGQNKRNVLQLYHALPWTSHQWQPDVEVEVPEEYHDLVTAMLRAEGGLQIKDRKWHFRTYRHCFVGSELVDWLVANRGLSRDEAFALGQRMFELGIFAHVCDPKQIFRDGHYFYRFQICEQYVKIDDAIKNAAEQVAENMRKKTMSESKLRPTESPCNNNAMYVDRKLPSADPPLSQAFSGTSSRYERMPAQGEPLRWDHQAGHHVMLSSPPQRTRDKIKHFFKSHTSTNDVQFIV